MMKKSIFLIVGLLISLITIQAQTWTQTGEDIDGEAEYDNSGQSISSSSDGSVVAIGAYANDGNGSNAGHVRIYQNNAGTWTQTGEDIDGEATNDQSGYSVSLSSDGSIVAVGACNNDGNGLFSGHVRIYQNNAGTWTQIGEDIDGEATGDMSGGSVSLSSDGSIVAVGAYGNNGNGTYSGHVRIYQNNAGTWTQTGEDIDGEAEGDRSGCSVDLNSDGSVVAVGAYGNDGNGTYSGHVRIYQNNAGTWTQTGEDIDGEAEGDRSGCSVSLSSDGSIVAVGAHGNDENGSGAGHVRIYQNNAGTWTQIGDDIDGEEEEDQSGHFVSLSSDGSVIAVGAHQNNGNGSDAGHVRIYQNNAGTWQQIGLDIDGEATGDHSGYSISLNSDGSIVAVGAYWNDGSGNCAGHVKVYNYHTLIIKNLSESGISFYPNPTSGIINVEFADNNIQRISISDITGKTIIEKTEIQQNETIDLSSFERGIYIISIQTDKEIFTTKIVKE